MRPMIALIILAVAGLVLCSEGLAQDGSQAFAMGTRSFAEATGTYGARRA
jgi:hypothetical protein